MLIDNGKLQYEFDEPESITSGRDAIFDAVIIFERK